MRFDILNRLGVNHKCDRRTDGQVAVSNSAVKDQRLKHRFYQTHSTQSDYRG